MKRRHRVVVEVTFEKPCTAKQAAWGIRALTDAFSYRPRAGGLWAAPNYGDIKDVKEFDRVVEGLRRTGQLELPL